MWLTIVTYGLRAFNKVLDWQKRREIRQAERDKITSEQQTARLKNISRAQSALRKLSDPDELARLRADVKKRR